MNYYKDPDATLYISREDIIKKAPDQLFHILAIIADLVRNNPDCDKPDWDDLLLTDEFTFEYLDKQLKRGGVVDPDLTDEYTFVYWLVTSYLTMTDTMRQTALKDICRLYFERINQIILSETLAELARRFTHVYQCVILFSLDFTKYLLSRKNGNV